jgi:hypothetical protein
MATAFLYLREQVQGTNAQIEAIAQHMTALQTAVESTGAGFRGSVNVALDPEPPVEIPPPEATA